MANLLLCYQRVGLLLRYAGRRHLRPQFQWPYQPGRNNGFLSSEITWGFENTPIPNGKVVAYRTSFLANAGAGNGEGIMEFSNNMPDLTARVATPGKGGSLVKTPGGARHEQQQFLLQEDSANPNPQQMRWSQSSEPQPVCLQSRTSRTRAVLQHGHRVLRGSAGDGATGSAGLHCGCAPRGNRWLLLNPLVFFTPANNRGRNEPPVC